VNIVSSRARGSLEPDHVGCGLRGFGEGTVLYLLGVLARFRGLTRYNSSVIGRGRGGRPAHVTAPHRPPRRPPAAAAAAAATTCQKQGAGPGRGAGGGGGICKQKHAF
jgi:hypothetical protein